MFLDWIILKEIFFYCQVSEIDDPWKNILKNFMFLAWKIYYLYENILFTYMT